MQLVIQAHKVQEVTPAHKASQDQQVLQVHVVTLEKGVQLVTQGLLEFQEVKVLKVYLVTLV